MSLEQFHQDEIDVILAYLEANDGDIQKTAKATGISARKLRELVAAWDQKAREEAAADNGEAADDDPEDENGPKLSYKQQRFIEAYLGQANGNATEAARIAGYRGNDVTLAAVGYENLRKPQIAAAISAHLQQSAMSADEVLLRLSEQAQGRIGDFGTGLADRFLLDLGKAQRRGLFRLVKKLGYNQNGDPQLELYSAQKALEILARYHGLLSASRDTELDAVVERLLAEVAAKRQGAGARTAGSGEEPSPTGTDASGGTESGAD